MIKVVKNEFSGHNGSPPIIHNGLSIPLADKLVKISSNVLYSGIYIGDPENDNEIISFVTSKIDVPKTDIQKKMDDGVIDLIIDDETISSNIDGWVARHLKNSFKFRKHQKETIISIISNILNSENKNPCHMVEAPTGSGKSLINIISAGVLDEYYGFTSYILCSDLFLWEQYANFLKENPEQYVITAYQINQN